MANFKLNAGYKTEKDIAADHFLEKGSFTIFYSAANEQVYTVPTTEVRSIELLKQ
jgi:hypothetical protein